MLDLSYILIDYVAISPFNLHWMWRYWSIQWQLLETPSSPYYKHMWLGRHVLHWRKIVLRHCKICNFYQCGRFAYSFTDVGRVLPKSCTLPCLAFHWFYVLWSFMSQNKNMEDSTQPVVTFMEINFNIWTTLQHRWDVQMHLLFVLGPSITLRWTPPLHSTLKLK